MPVSRNAAEDVAAVCWQSPQREIIDVQEKSVDRIRGKSYTLTCMNLHFNVFVCVFADR